MRIVLVVFTLLLVAASLAGGFYAVRVTKSVEVNTNPSVKQPAPAPLKHMDTSRNVWKEPKQKLPEFKAPQPRPQSAEVQTEYSPLTGDLPKADTVSSVSVSTCGGGTMVLSAAEEQMFDLHNRERQSRGLGSLCLSVELTKLARNRSIDMMDRDYFSHYTPDTGEDVSDMVEGTRIGQQLTLIGENLSKGGDGTDTDTPEYMFNGLMNSPGHKANIVRPQYTEIGVGAISGQYQQYADVSTIYTMVFGA